MGLQPSLPLSLPRGVPEEGTLLWGTFARSSAPLDLVGSVLARPFSWKQRSRARGRPLGLAGGGCGAPSCRRPEASRAGTLLRLSRAEGGRPGGRPGGRGCSSPQKRPERPRALTAAASLPRGTFRPISGQAAGPFRQWERLPESGGLVRHARGGWWRGWSVPSGPAMSDWEAGSGGDDGPHSGPPQPPRASPAGRSATEAASPRARGSQEGAAAEGSGRPRGGGGGGALEHRARNPRRPPAGRGPQGAPPPPPLRFRLDNALVGSLIGRGLGRRRPPRGPLSARLWPFSPAAALRQGGLAAHGHARGGSAGQTPSQ